MHNDYRDLTSGSIGRKLVVFALPLLCSSLVQQLYNTVDLIFAGNLIDSNASAAIGMSGMLITCLVGFFGGMSVGAGVVIARKYGREDYRGLNTAIHSTAALCLVGSVLMLALGEALTPLYLRMVHTPQALLPMATAYLRIYFLSMPSIIFYNLCSGMLRSMGDSRSTLIAQITGGLINVLADWFFIARLHFSVEGAAWATMLSQTISAIYVTHRLMRLEGSYALRLRQVRMDAGVLGETLRTGIPAGLQALVITLSNVVAQYHINGLGQNAIAAFTAYFKVELIVYYPIVALGQAMMTFAAQNLGAGRNDRILRGQWKCLGLGLGVSMALSAASLIMGKPLFRIFFSNQEAIALGLRIMTTTFPFYFVYCFMQIPGDALRGVGEARLPMIIVTIGLCGVRTLLLYLLAFRWHDVRAIAVCYPITWALAGGCMLVSWLRKGRTLKTANNRQ